MFCLALCAIQITLKLKAIDLLGSYLMFYIFDLIGLIKQKDLLAKHRTSYIAYYTVFEYFTTRKDSAFIRPLLHICSLKID